MKKKIILLRKLNEIKIFLEKLKKLNKNPKIPKRPNPQLLLPSPNEERKFENLSNSQNWMILAKLCKKI